MLRYKLCSFLIILLTQYGFVRSLISTDLSSSQVYVDDEGRYQSLVISINLKMSREEDKDSFLKAVKVSFTVYILLNKKNITFNAATDTNPAVSVQAFTLAHMLNTRV